MILTLAEAKASRLVDVAGVCADSAQFLSILNEATEQLMQRGHWFNTVRKIRGCIYNKCITWPRSVGTVLAMNACTTTVPVYNNWYEFTPMDSRDCGCLGGYRNRNVLVNDGTSPVYNQIECDQGMYIRIYPTQPSDVGKSVTLYGIDTNGQTVRSERDDGTFQDGIVITIAAPYSSTQIQFRKITRVLKDPTDGPIRLYQYDITNDVLLDMAYYEAGETSPDYRHTFLNGQRRNICYGCNDGLKQITALVKLEFVPVRYDSDVVQIDYISALKLGIQAVKEGEAYDHRGYNDSMMLAVRELNLRLNDKFPLDQIPVSIRGMGTAKPSRAGIGALI